MLKCLVNITNSNCGVIYITGTPAYNKAIQELKPNYNIGWINYFSNNFVLPIPNNLEGWEYEFTVQGRYIILARHGFEYDETGLYTPQVEQIISTMKFLKENIIGYC